MDRGYSVQPKRRRNDDVGTERVGAVSHFDLLRTGNNHQPRFRITGFMAAGKHVTRLVISVLESS